ncbi:deoxyribonuclease-like protein tatD [Hyaloscypha hepaticicola]|uniref:Deoxyribonuclease-like protein tatD n=1 Tax=Hyaloscypha hepaticicola TaxID=2082293 RepID=A0A2J6QL45_9HELO|nr:deoxyribonuclease-like protein tatD [Hyaloscypha hepaticicola]
MSINNALDAPQPSAVPSNGVYRPRYIDIGINLTDPVYSGKYYGTQRHPYDLPGVLQRAKEAGCQKLIVTGSDLTESKKAIELAKAHPGIIYTTVGVHPCSCKQFTKTSTSSSIFLTQLKALALAAKESGHCVAFGEIGLDYDRLELCPKDIQLEYFAKQLDVAVEVGLPLFLHSRAAHQDFIRLLKERDHGLQKRGVVHSFTGTKEEMLELVEMGWDIGVNGCSLKTEDNCSVVKEIPLERLQLETDGPWCEMRASHEGTKFLGDYKEEKEVKWVKKEKWVEGAAIKGRNEPCMIGKVAWAVAGIKGIGVEVVAEAAWRNSVKMFTLGEMVEGKVS